MARKQKSSLVFGKASRLAWRLAILAVATWIFGQVHSLIESFETPDYVCFFGAGAVGLGFCQLFCDYVVKDETTTEATFRDGCCLLLYMYLLAPLVSVEFLPPLPATPEAFAEIGTIVDKGLVKHEHLAKVSEALWAESGRGDLVPWQLPALSQFAPTIKFAVKRSELEHTGRVIQRTKQGKTVRDYDLLQLKFWLPKAEPLVFDEEEDAATKAEAEGATDAAADGEDAPAADSAAPDSEDANAADGKAADAVEDEIDLSAAERSYVFMVARASPKLGLWSDAANQPEVKSNKKGANAKAAKLAAAVAAQKLEETVYVCGRLFNGIPRGEAMDADAIRLDRDLPKDPNSLAFSLRAEACSGDPWLFGHSGWAVYTFFIPVYFLMRKALDKYNSAVFKEEKDAGYAEEWAQVKTAALNLFAQLSGKNKRSD